MLIDALVPIDCRVASIRALAKSAASDNHPITRPPLLILIDAPLSSRLSAPRTDRRDFWGAIQATASSVVAPGATKPNSSARPYATGEMSTSGSTLSARTLKP